MDLLDVIRSGGFDVPGHAVSPHRQGGIAPRARRRRWSDKVQHGTLIIEDSDDEEEKPISSILIEDSDDSSVVFEDSDDEEELSLHHRIDLTQSSSTIVGGHLAGVYGPQDGEHTANTSMVRPELGVIPVCLGPSLLYGGPKGFPGPAPSDGVRVPEL
mmetsp:Transcript_535/g.1236  ORF Transcript_535/g.1236 Transcript_535/m.1236 type:complete len:158 (-) Transcript_535:17-490(-)